MNTKIRKPNAYLVQRVKDDRQLRLAIAARADVSEIAVKKWLSDKSKSELKLLHYDLVQFYLENDFTLSEIFGE
ncbi:MAG: hypothetical protein KA974_10015 [Saprospiraceae bacterium]|nr:hypothetical protein [Saprospiraceae bacterium]